MADLQLTAHLTEPMQAKCTITMTAPLGKWQALAEALDRAYDCELDDTLRVFRYSIADLIKLVSQPVNTTEEI